MLLGAPEFKAYPLSMLIYSLLSYSTQPTLRNVFCKQALSFLLQPLQIHECPST